MNHKPFVKLGLVAVLCLIIGAEAWAQPFFNRGQQRERQRSNPQYQRDNSRYQRDNARYQRQQPYYQNQDQNRYQNRRQYQRQPQYQYTPQDQYYHQKSNPANRGFLTPDFHTQAEQIRRANYGDVIRVPVPQAPYQRPYYRGY